MLAEDGMRLKVELAAERAEGERLRRALAELKGLILNGEWFRGDGRTHLAIRVADGADLSCRATREDALRAALAKYREVTP